MSHIPTPPSKAILMKQPPCAVDLEKAILGALIISKNSINEVVGILEPEVFYVGTHQLIYKVILKLYEDKVGIDLLTISEYLKRINKLDYIGGDFYLIELTEQIYSIAHIEFHCRIVLQKYILRKLIKLSDETIEIAYSSNPDAIALMDHVTTNINRIQDIAIREEIGNTELYFEKEKRELYEKVLNNDSGKFSGILFGISEFDEWCGGIQNTDLVTLAARPGMGKTTTAISIAYFNSFIRKVPTAFFSLEMPSVDVKNKITSGALRIPYKSIRQGNLNKTQLSKILDYYDKINRSLLFIIDTFEHKNNFEKIEAKIRDLVLNHGLKLVLIDYVQLIVLTKSLGGDTADLSKITRNLKALANELKVPIIILAQLNRKVDDRPDRTPVLSDLKQSGSIEEDSDMVIFLLRKAYYDMIGKPDLEIPNDELFKTLLIVAKGRHTGVKTFTTYLDLLKSKIVSFCDKEY